VLLVGGEVDNQIGLGDQLLIGAHGETIAGGVLPGLTLLFDGRVAQGVRNVEAAVAQVQPLMQSLGAAADDDDLLALEGLDAVELRGIHEAALTKLLKLQPHGRLLKFSHCLLLIVLEICFSYTSPHHSGIFCCVK
jgi:hypothetical protein